jgi:hypothetical protein
VPRRRANAQPTRAESDSARIAIVPTHRPLTWLRGPPVLLVVVAGGRDRASVDPADAALSTGAKLDGVGMERQVRILKRSTNAAVVLFSLTFLAAAASSAPSQPEAAKQSFTATAVANNNVASGVGTVYIDITRWSSEDERAKLVATLKKDGPAALLDELQDMKPTGSIRTPDSVAYDLRYAHQSETDEGGRRIVLATDRPMGFWEAHARPRTVDYPFTVIQMEIGRDGTGKGTLSYATRITEAGGVIALEGFATSPIMLTQIQARKAGN